MPPHLCQGANILFLPIPPAPSAPRRASCPAPCFYTFRRAPALHPATPFEKGVDPKTFSADGQHTFYGRAKNPECRNNGFPGTDLWTPVAVPSVGVLCFRAGGTKSLHETPTDSPASPSRPQKVFEGSKGRFFKNAPLAGRGTASHKRRASQSARHAFSGGTKSFHETPTDRPALPSRT